MLATGQPFLRGRRTATGDCDVARPPPRPGMSMVDWLLTEQLLAIFQEALAKREGLNATLEARSPLGEHDVLAGAGAAVRIEATDGAVLVVTPRRIQRVMDERGLE